MSPHRWHDPAAFDDLLSLADVDRALAGTGLRQPAFRLVRDGQVLDRRSVTRTARTGATRIDDLIDPGRVFAAFADGATVVLQSLQRWWPPLTRFCRDLEVGLGHQVQANAYLTPPGATGLAPHHDTHDVFVLQVRGSKHWTIREALTAAPLPTQRSDHEAAARQPVLFEAELTAGDCLYLPRGVIHSAAAQSGVSLHITIGVLAVTVHDVLRRLVDQAGDEPAFRAALPVGYPSDREVAVDAVKAAIAELVGWLESVDPAPVADDLRHRFWSRRPPLLEGQLLELATLDALDDTTVVERRPGSVCEVEVVEGRLRATLGDRVVDLPAPAEPAVRRLLDGTATRAADLADLLDEGGRLVLVRRLVREGLLRRAAVT